MKLTREEAKELFSGLGIASLSDMTDDWTGWILSQLHDPVRLAAWNKLLDIVETVNPVEYQRLSNFAKANKGILLEYQGYEKWLYTVGPHSFTGEMSDFHRDFWDWYWPITQKQRAGKPMNLEDLTYFAIWGRGLGKSTNAEWLAIAEGCLIGKGFVLYVSGTAEQAEAHVEAIRDRLETEGALQQLYPGMRKPVGKGGFVGEHKQYGWRQDYLMTANSWAVRPVGLDKAIRGWKRGDTRVSLIVLDDIDDDDDSPEVILKKERRIAKKILPMGTARTKVVFAQNLIHSNSVLNRMHTRQTDILALRRGDVAIKSFEQIEIQHQQTVKGPRNVIVNGTPTWPHIDMAECQSFLDRSGRDGFLAEYQHDFSGEQHDRVLPEYDDRITMAHVITWGQFTAKYGTDRIPSEWPCDLGLDLGYTSGHISAWSFLAKAPEGFPLSGSIFRYRGCTFAGVGIDEQAVLVRAKMWPNEKVARQFLSHEKLGEQLTLNQKYSWHFRPCSSAKTAGLAQWRHFLQVDRSRPHPFHRDEKDGDTGLWRIGCPAWFDIVASSQFHVRDMKDDAGLKTHRDQTFKWRMRPVEETKSGMTVEQPMKAREDTCDSSRMCLDQFGPVGRPLSPAQKVQQVIPQGYHKNELAQTRPANEAYLTAEMAEWLAKRALKSTRPPQTDEWGQRI